jgi:hypothetical protein
MNSRKSDTPRQSEADRLRRRYESRPAAFLSWLETYWRVHLGLIALGVALVLANWMYLIHLDNVWTAAHPQDASGGMAAFSEALYHFFHASMLMIPTLWLILLMSRFETVYAAYSKFLFWLSATLPVLMVGALRVRNGSSIFSSSGFWHRRLFLWRWRSAGGWPDPAPRRS